jgi:hypothetical protein
MRSSTGKLALILASLIAFQLSFSLDQSRAASPEQDRNPAARQAVTARRVPVLGGDMSFASTPSVLIEGWQDRAKGDAMAEAFQSAGIRSLRFLFGGLYSPEGLEATNALKVENKLTNEYKWFPIDDFVDFEMRHDFTVVIGVNVEESPDVALRAVRKFVDRGLRSKIVAIELSNEPWLNHRPWMPEEFANKAADVIEKLTPLRIPFGVPLTVGKEKKTPTKLSDDEWNARMLRALTARIDLKKRSDIYGIIHLYARGVRGGTIDAFNKAVLPFLSQPRYLVTEFNIRSSLEGNPHLTNEYAMEFALRVAELMSRPEIEALYVHSLPFHSVLYWANGRRYATVVGHRDPKLTGNDLSPGWHLTPTGKVYGLFSRLAWNGELLEYRGGDDQSYWTVRTKGGGLVTTLVNADDKPATWKILIAGKEKRFEAPRQSIVCYDSKGVELERLVLP